MSYRLQGEIPGIWIQSVQVSGEDFRYQQGGSVRQMGIISN